MKSEIIIYTDGACKGNPGVGGWGAILKYKDKNKKIYGYEVNTTNGGIIDFTDPRALEKQGPVADQRSRERDYFEGVSTLSKNLNREPTSAEIEGFFDYTRGSAKPGYRDPNISNAAAELQRRGAAGRSVNSNVNTPTAGRGKELKRMVVPFYSGKMGGQLNLKGFNIYLVKLNKLQ